MASAIVLVIRQRLSCGQPTTRRHAPPRRRSSLRLVALLFATSLSCSTTGSRDDQSATEHTSYVLGYSTGAGFRGVVPILPDELRQGLLDGLGEETAARVMSRPELFARIRRVMQRLGDAELAALSARIDESQN